jgi:hypothetical protein
MRVEGRFLADSVRIGEETAFYLSAHYPAATAVLFPDSSHNFFPFEYVRKVYFATETSDGVSRDSAVYFLMTFETESTQALGLPVYALSASDCTVYQTQADSISLVELVDEIPDSVTVENLPLKMNTAYQPVSYQLNAMLLLIIAGALLIIAVIVWIFFGRRIASYFKAKKLLRRHREFVASYNAFIRELSTTFSRAGTESALSTWKKYMEQLESMPYTKLTTRETARLHGDEMLAQNLRAIDQAIYGHATTVVGPLEELRSVADARFTRKLQEVRHGK